MNILTPRVKKTIGSTFILLGISAFTVSGWVYMNPIQDKPSISIKKAALKSCKNEAVSLGYIANGRNSLEITQNGLEEWERDLSSFSMILYKCNGFKLQSFCMGRSCKDSKNNYVYGTTMKLTYTGKRATGY